MDGQTWRITPINYDWKDDDRPEGAVLAGKLHGTEEKEKAAYYTC
jgi:hypothetical protein